MRALRKRPESGNALLQRRAMLAGFMGLAATAALGRARERAPDSASPRRFLAARRHGLKHEAVLLDVSGHDLASLPLPDRGHSFAVDPAGSRAVVFGRQPGFFAQVLSLPDCAQRGELALPANRHFFGHGVFAANGSVLYATENDFDAGRGVLGVYEARQDGPWRRLGEFDTGGIGPHEVVLLPDGATLCVANGGLLTHPDYGKTALNLATMRPSLAYIDASSGRLLENVVLPAGLFQLSIRHLAVDETGAVWFACQHQGSAAEQPPLLGRHRRGMDPQLLTAPAQAQRELRNYLGSIALDAKTGLIATTSPVGGSVAFWNASNGQWLGSTMHADGCGVAALGNRSFLVSDGFGALITAGPGMRGRILQPASPEMAWDNHMRLA